MDERTCRIGLIGLGVMGHNLVLNMADHGIPVAVFNRTASVTRAFASGPASGSMIKPCYSLKELVSSLANPRPVMMMVSAGSAVDTIIEQLKTFLEAGDVIIDGGNSHFRDTERRISSLEKTGIHYLGTGISGGGSGARYGPSMMPGGTEEGYRVLRRIFEAVAAQVDGQPCVTYLGPGSAGHYVKMVHNGIEYALMELISETYDLMKRGLGMTNGDMHNVYDAWGKAELNSYLMEITADILLETDQESGGHLIDMIIDRAGQRGTGKWTSQEAMDLQVPIPTIDMAVSMRDMSALKSERENAARILPGPSPSFEGDREIFIEQIRNSLYASAIIAFTQGMALLGKASEVYNYGMDLGSVARIWQGGCIIRASLLKDICGAYSNHPDLPNLLVNPDLGKKVMARQEDLRALAGTAARLGLPIPALMSALTYFDSYRSAWLPANLIQAQRDYFGAHTYERIDAVGFFHTEWRRGRKS